MVSTTPFGSVNRRTPFSWGTFFPCFLQKPGDKNATFWTLAILFQPKPAFLTPCGALALREKDSDAHDLLLWQRNDLLAQAFSAVRDFLLRTGRHTSTLLLTLPLRRRPRKKNHEINPASLLRLRADSARAFAPVLIQSFRLVSLTQQPTTSTMDLSATAVLLAALPL